MGKRVVELAQYVVDLLERQRLGRAEIGRKETRSTVVAVRSSTRGCGRAGASLAVCT